MRATLVFTLTLGLTSAAPFPWNDKHQDHGGINVQLGPQPYYLVNDMNEGLLKKKLQTCFEGLFHATDFTFGHRRAPLQFLEHTEESYRAAARMGIGVIECDVTFAKTSSSYADILNANCIQQPTFSLFPSLRRNVQSYSSPQILLKARQRRLRAALAISHSPNSRHSAGRWTHQCPLRQMQLNI